VQLAALDDPLIEQRDQHPDQIDRRGSDASVAVEPRGHRPIEDRDLRAAAVEHEIVEREVAVQARRRRLRRLICDPIVEPLMRQRQLFVHQPQQAGDAREDLDLLRQRHRGKRCSQRHIIVQPLEQQRSGFGRRCQRPWRAERLRGARQFIGSLRFCKLAQQACRRLSLQNRVRIQRDAHGATSLALPWRSMLFNALRTVRTSLIRGSRMPPIGRCATRAKLTSRTPARTSMPTPAAAAAPSRPKAG
jgi:hypothetical protein